MADGGAPTRSSSMWPLTMGCVVVGIATVAVLLAPVSPTPRDWIVRGLLALLAVGAVASVAAHGGVDRTVSNRGERVGFQAAFFWAFVTGAYFVFSSDDMSMRPVEAVIAGAASALMFGTLMWLHDAWLSPPPSS